MEGQRVARNYRNMAFEGEKKKSWSSPSADQILLRQSTHGLVPLRYLPWSSFCQGRRDSLRFPLTNPLVEPACSERSDGATDSLVDDLHKQTSTVARMVREMPKH